MATELIPTKFVASVEVIDPDSKLPVEIEIRKLATGPMIGLDGCYLAQLTDGENPQSPYDEPGVLLEIPDDET